jgi:hypothetical protein
MEAAMKLTMVEMNDAVAKWTATRGDDMTGRELELARAYFQEHRNSRAVSRINAVLRMQLMSRLRMR